MKNIILLFLCLFLIKINVFSQEKNFTQVIRGQIIDAHSETSLIGASVVILGSDPIMGAVTDIDGYFKLENVEIGRINLKFSYIGYKPIILRNQNLKTGKELVLNISLEEQIIKTEEVVITAKSKKSQTINEMAMISARSFSVEETERYAGSMGDPSRMVANYAGVSSASDSRNDIVIRGNSPLGLLWRLDGMDIPSPNHFGALGTTGGPVSMLNNNLLSNSDFFTGAFPAEYGNAMSGAFDLKMRNGNYEKREYVGQVGFNGFELGAEGYFNKNSKATYLINYRYSTLAFMDKIGLDFGAGAIPQYQDLNFKFNFPLRKGRFSIFGIGGMSYIEFLDSKIKDEDRTGSYAIASDTDTYMDSDVGILGMSYVHFFENNLKLETNFTVSGSKVAAKVDSVRKDDNDNLIGIYPFARSHSNENKYGFSTKIKKKINAKNNFDIGFSVDNYQINYVDSFLPKELDHFINTTNIDDNLQLFQSYAQIQHRFTDLLSLYLGLHTQKTSLNDEIAIEPRASLKWQFSESQFLTFGTGLHSQMQARFIYFVETLVDTTNGVYTRTNENLEFSKSLHFVLAYDNSFTENLRFKAELYYQDLYDIPVDISTPEFSMSNYGSSFYLERVDSLVNEGTGKNYGIELTLEKFLSNNYYFLMTSSIFESKYKAYDKIERNTAFNGNFVNNVLFGYEIPIGKKASIDCNLKVIWAGGKRYVPIDFEASKSEREEVLNWNEAYKKRHDDYFKIDMRISFKLNWKNINQEWALDIQNLTNRENIFMENYNVSTNEMRKEYQSGIFPMFLYRILF